VPVPLFVKKGDLNRDLALSTAAEIAKLSDDLIEYVVKRAASKYGDPATEAFAQEVVTGLAFRRSKVQEWLTDRLK